MTSRHASAIFLLLFACSAPEDANRAARCDADGLCADGRVCYRGFCVLDEEAPGALDSDADADVPGSMAPPSAAAGDASTADASARRDAGNGMDGDNDADVEESADASVRAPSLPDAAPLPGAPSDAAAAVSDAAPTDAAGESDDGSTTPSEDAAAGGGDPDSVNRELRRCLVLCGADQDLCYSCLSTLVTEHPEVCAGTGAGARESLLASLCTLLCTVAGCGAP